CSSDLHPSSDEILGFWKRTVSDRRLPFTVESHKLSTGIQSLGVDVLSRALQAGGEVIHILHMSFHLRFRPLFHRNVIHRCWRSSVMLQQQIFRHIVLLTRIEVSYSADEPIRRFSTSCAPMGALTLLLIFVRHHLQAMNKCDVNR